MLAAKEIKRHNTAIKRNDFSVPTKALMKQGILSKDKTFFDYGCGRGDDIRMLKKKGYDVGGWDPYHAPDHPKSEADIVNLGFVINVIEDPEERTETIERAWALAKEALVVSTRPPMKHNFKPYSDGFITGSDTFQKFWKASELKAYLEETLGVEVERLANCSYIAYKDAEEARKAA